MEFNPNKLYTIGIDIGDNKNSIIGYFKNIKHLDKILCVESTLNVGKEREAYPFKIQGMQLDLQKINSIKESTEEEIALFNNSISEVQNFKDFYAKFDNSAVGNLFKITYKNDVVTYFYFVPTPENIIGGYHTSNKILIDPSSNLVELIHFNKDTEKLQGILIGIAANITKIEKLSEGKEYDSVLRAIVLNQIYKLQNNE